MISQVRCSWTCFTCWDSQRDYFWPTVAHYHWPLLARSSRCDSAIPLALPGQIALGGAAIAMDEFDAHLDEHVALHLDDGSSLFKRVGAKLPAPLQHLRQFESIGGLGLADVLAIDCEHKGLRRVMHAFSIIGVLYR